LRTYKEQVNGTLPRTVMKILVPYGSFMKQGVRLCVVQQCQSWVWPNDIQKLFVVDVERPGNERLPRCPWWNELLEGNVMSVFHIYDMVKGA
jgi:hypothetical protein